MSFSSEVKRELAGRISSARHCQLAEILAILLCDCVAVRGSDKELSLFMRTSDTAAVRKLFTLLKKTFNICSDAFPETDRPAGGRLYEALPVMPGDAETVLSAVRLIREDGSIRSARDGISQIITKNSCCKRAFLRDAFLCTGSVSDPVKSYHMEFVCDEEMFADGLCSMIRSFDVDAKRVKRGHRDVVYIKESVGIVELLGLMDAPVALMNMENERIVREMRGNVNRRVNCEAANITKTVDAATKQIEDIRFLEQTDAFAGLSGSLKEAARIRLLYPEASYAELGKLMDPPVGKSGVNHRLRRLQELAQDIREEKIL